LIQQVELQRALVAEVGETDPWCSLTVLADEKWKLARKDADVYGAYFIESENAKS